MWIQRRFLVNYDHVHFALTLLYRLSIYSLCKTCLCTLLDNFGSAIKRIKEKRKKEKAKWDWYYYSNAKGSKRTLKRSEMKRKNPFLMLKSYLSRGVPSVCILIKAFTLWHFIWLSCNSLFFFIFSPSILCFHFRCLNGQKKWRWKKNGKLILKQCVYFVVELSISTGYNNIERGAVKKIALFGRSKSFLVESTEWFFFLVLEYFLTLKRWKHKKGKMSTKRILIWALGEANCILLFCEQILSRITERLMKSLNKR